jgi:hypothetical protein
MRNEAIELANKSLQMMREIDSLLLETSQQRVKRNVDSLMESAAQGMNGDCIDDCCWDDEGNEYIEPMPKIDLFRSYESYLGALTERDLEAIEYEYEILGDGEIIFCNHIYMRSDILTNMFPYGKLDERGIGLMKNRGTISTIKQTEENAC